VGGADIDISVQFRTLLSDGLLLFAFGGAQTYFMLQIVNATLLWKMSINGEDLAFPLNDDSVSPCDGQWHVVALGRTGTQMKLSIDSSSFVSPGDPNVLVDGIALTSYLYVGGIPDDDSEAIEFIDHNQLRPQIQRSASLIQCNSSCLSTWLFVCVLMARRLNERK